MHFHQLSRSQIPKIPTASPMPTTNNGKYDRGEGGMKRDNSHNKLLLKYFCEYYENIWPWKHITRTPCRPLEGAH